MDYNHGMYLFPEDTTYTLEVTDARGRGGPDHWFVVFVRTYEPGAGNDLFSYEYEPEVEPNDIQEDGWSPEQEPDIADDGSTFLTARFDGVLEEELDEDWATITAEPGYNLSARCWSTDIGSTSPLTLEFINPDGTVLGGVSSDDADPLEVYNLPATQDGDHSVRIYSTDLGPYGLGAWYRCVVWNTTWEIPT